MSTKLETRTVPSKVWVCACDHCGVEIEEDPIAAKKMISGAARFPVTTVVMVRYDEGKSDYFPSRHQYPNHEFTLCNGCLHQLLDFLKVPGLRVPPRNSEIEAVKK